MTFEIILEQQFAIRRVDRTRRSMIARVLDIETRAEERALNLCDRFQIRLRKRYSVFLNLIPHFPAGILEKLRIGGGRIDVFDHVFDVARIPPFCFWKRLAKKGAEILDAIARAREQRLEKKMLKLIIFSNVDYDRHLRANL